MSGRPDISVEVHVVDDPELIASVMNQLREAKAAREAEDDVDYHPDLTQPMDDIWVAVSVNDKGEQRILTSPDDRRMPLVIPAADLLPVMREVIGDIDPKGDRFEMRRYHLAETEDITPDAPAPKESTGA